VFLGVGAAAPTPKNTEFPYEPVVQLFKGAFEAEAAVSIVDSVCVYSVEMVILEMGGENRRKETYQN
jgi:hypothetical protein